ncbi:MAG: undecaprenyl-diphosphatase [Acetobacteraceae bacterium]
MNDSLFLAINAGPHPPTLVLAVARLIAVWAVPAAVVLFVLLWIRVRPERRGALITATFVMALGLILNFLIGLAYFHPRPFMVGLGQQHLPHAPDSSFPSDHATFLWSLGFGLLVLGAWRILAALMLAAGVGVAWARVYLGVHFPFDMLGALVVSLIVTCAARRLYGPVGSFVLPPCNRGYEALITAFHLPAVIFPRTGRADSRSGQ